MLKLEYKDNTGKNWVRISKSEARKLYDRGEKVCFCRNPETGRYTSFYKMEV